MHTQSTSLYPHSLLQRPPVLIHLPPQREGSGPVTLCLLQEPKAQFLRSVYQFPLPPMSGQCCGQEVPTLALESASSSRNPGSIYQKTRSGCWMCSFVTWLSLLRDHLSVQSQEIHICILTCTCTHICDYFLYMYMHLYLY